MQKEEKLKERSRLNSFENLFRQFHPALVAYAYNFLKSREDAMEVVQDVFVSIWNKRDELQFDAGLKGYLYAATRNKSLNYIQKKKLPTVTFSPALHDGQSENPADEALETAELEVALYDEIYQLPEKCRKIFLLSRQEGMTYREIAESLNISIKTVENQIGIALKRIRKRLIEFNNAGKIGLLLLILLTFFGGILPEICIYS